jgi:hypothetical protein
LPRVKSGPPKRRDWKFAGRSFCGWYADLPAEETALADGENYEIQVGERTIEKTWKSMYAVYRALGLKPFLAVCTVTFKALSNAIGNTRAEALQMEERTGERRLTAIRKLQPAVELKQAA